MVKDPQRVRLEQIDWAQTFPFVRLFEALRMAIWPPSKLLLALLLIALLWIGGGLLDAIAGPGVYQREVEAYARETRSDFDKWLQREEARVQNGLYSATYKLPVQGERAWDKVVKEPDRFALIRAALAQYHAKRVEALRTQYESAESEARSQTPPRAAPMSDADFETRKARLEQERRDDLATVASFESTGIFFSALQFKLAAFERMVTAAISLNFGFSELASSGPLSSNTVLGAMRDLAIVLPGWLLHRHPVFLTIWCLFAMALWSLIGGAISRMTALHATRGDSGSVTQALRFARRRWFWFFITPFFPLLIAAVCGLAVAIVGVLFNVFLLDILAGAAFGVLLLLGFLIAMALVLIAVGSGLFYPAIAVEGTDSFDALSRTGNYVFGRFWHWLFYSIVALVYGAVGYLLLGAVAFLTLSVTRFFAGMWVVAQTSDGRPVFDVMLPEPQIGQLSNPVEWSQLDVTSVAAAGLVTIWVYLLIGLLAAFAISYYFASHTFIYLLLRRAADGTECDAVYVDDREPRAWAAPKSDEPGGQDPVVPAQPLSGESQT